MSKPDKATLLELAGLFLRIGFTSFGGPAAHIAMMHAEIVTRRQWLDDRAFLDLVSASNLIPGPNSTELAIHIGYRRAGWPGLLVAGACFILPAVFIVLLLAWVYVRYNALPAVEALFYGIKPVVAAIVFYALWGLGRTVLRSPAAVALAAGAALIAWLGWVSEIALLLIGGALIALTRHGWRSLRGSFPAMWGGVGLPLAASPEGGALATLFWSFFKIGSVLYGSGYVLLAFLRAEFVQNLGWLSDQQLLDAVAIGQFTPGPLFTTATFVGYLVGGLPGAFLATLGIFLPAFIFVALSIPFLERMRQSALFGAFLDGVNVISLALMAVVSAQLASAALVDWVTLAACLAALGVLLYAKINSAWLVAAGAALGLLVMLVGA